MVRSKTTRRRFLKDTAIGLTAATLLTSSKSKSRAASASDRVRIGVIGCGNQGTNHLRSLGSLENAQIAGICDVDEKRLADAQKLATSAQAVTDLRRLLDDRTIDAVSIVAPDHWHVPATLLALEAGKHVYVEKPCCHNIREGQLLRDAVAKSDRVVVHGTQSRSNPAIRQAIKMLHDGLIGDILIAKAWNWQQRKNIGHLEPSAPPSGVDYDTWVGPAEWMPFQTNRFHYDWHWWFNFGCGDMGNDGIHELDYALWGLGVKTHPSVISAAGGKFFFDDDQQFPDTQQVTFEFASEGKPGDRRMLIYEQRLWSTTYPNNVDSGAEFYGTKGRMFLSKRGKFEVVGERNKPIDAKLDQEIRSAGPANFVNWLSCIESGGAPNANIENAVRTATAVHLGNTATRLGRTIHFDPASEKITGDDEANALLQRSYRQDGHWSIPAGV